MKKCCPDCYSAGSRIGAFRNQFSQTKFGKSHRDKRYLVGKKENIVGTISEAGCVRA